MSSTNKYAVAVVVAVFVVVAVVNLALSNPCKLLDTNIFASSVCALEASRIKCLNSLGSAAIEWR